MGLHCAVDLHGDNGYYGVVDEDGNRLFSKRLPNDLATVVAALEPFRERLDGGVVVESTFNWYWLVDGLNEHGFETCLANPAAMKQYDGLKVTDDKTDTFFLAELARLNILPEGYIYPKEERPVRDLLRRRRLLVGQRTAHILSFQNLIARERGEKITSNGVQKLRPDKMPPLFDDARIDLMGLTSIEMIRFLTQQIRRIEHMVVDETKTKPQYDGILSIPGIGKALGLTIILETGDINRFRKVGAYTSYCRCVKSTRSSNNKLKGKNNQKNGNRYLSWAYVEAANFMRRYSPEAKAWYQRKIRRSPSVVATKALSSKISKACYFIMRDEVAFDIKMMFG